MSTRVTPVLLTCDRDLALTAQFVASFSAVQARLERPIVVIDTSYSARLSAKYLTLISLLNARSIYVHGAEEGMDLFGSVQEAAQAAVLAGLHESDDDSILFLEDDILFSTAFGAALDALETQEDTGFFTLYTPADGWPSGEVDPAAFFGAQCLLFPRGPLQEIVDSWPLIRSRWGGYEAGWSRFLGERGYKLRCDSRSYVQHLDAVRGAATESRLGSRDGANPPHWSNTFVD